MDDVAVRLAGVRLRYPTGTLALDGVDLAVPRGGIAALVGPSGCGKSTALRLVAGLERPTDGAVGVDLGASPPPQPIAFVFQEATLLPWRRVADNVALPLSLRGEPAGVVRDAVAEALARVGLEGFADHYPRELSGGMRMRVSLARALVTRPRVMLLDEPFGALDELTRQRLQDDLLALQATFGWTVLFVTHSTYEAVYLADRVFVFGPRPGKVVAELPIGLPRPRSEDVRGDPAFARQVAEASAVLREHLS